MAAVPDPLTPDELAALDAQYAPPLAFEKWPQEFTRAPLWVHRLSALEDLAESAPSETVARATDVAVRAAAWDTGAIEGLYTTNRGLTMTIATQAAAWDQEVATHGDAAALFDAQLKTYELVLDVATNARPVTEAWIRALHEELTEPQETYTVHTQQGPRQAPLPRGEYKQFPNHVETAEGTRHAYAPVADTPAEMHRFVQQLTSDEFARAHPIVQASYAHYAFVAIHPFADGNGRVARALASVYLYRAGRVPLLIFYDDRPRYFDALSEADTGNLGPFVDFISDASIGAIELVIDSLQTAARPSPHEGIERFRTLLTVQGGLTHTDLDTLAHVTLGHFQRVLNEETAKLPALSGLSIGLNSGTRGASGVPEGYRAVIAGGSPFIQMTLTANAPAQASFSPVFIVVVSQSRNEDADLFWVLQEGPPDGVRLALRDVHPELTSAAELRLRMYAERALGLALDTLFEAARGSFSASGYETEGPE